MRRILQKASAVLLCLLLFSGIGAAAVSSGAAREISLKAVSKEDIRTRGFFNAVQDALNFARDTASEASPVTVAVPAGSYDLACSLHIYDNTTLDLRGVTVTRKVLGNMLRVGDEDTVDSGATGYRYRNITLLGGTLDGNAGKNTMIKVAHAANFEMIGVMMRNERGGHMMEVAGADGFTARDCVFRDQILPLEGIGYEVIQFDILHPDHMVNCRAEDINCKHILVENCTFENVPRAIGTHTGVLNNPFDGVVIRDNLFRDIKSAAIQGFNWKNVQITGNRIESAARGISLYAIMYGGSGMYTADYLAKLGGTEVHVPCTYQPPRTTNIEIAYNTLRDIGVTDDIYASYVSQGVAVIGDTITVPDARDGAIPAGEYYHENVNIHDNDIEVHGHGVRLEETRHARISGNLLRCAENTAHPANYYGIVLMANARTDEITRNIITDAQVNGIQMVNSAVDTLSRNRVERTGKYGISAYHTSLRSVTENDVSGAANQGIVLLDASTVGSVSNNRVADCGKQGIYFTKDCAADSVSANTTVRCGGSIAYTRSTGKVKIGANDTETAALTSFELDGAGVRLGVGKSYLMVPDVRPVNAMTRFTFTSDNPDVAQTDKNGRISAVSAGEAVVTVTSENGKTATFQVIVTDGEEAELIPSGRLTTPKITTLECVEGGIRLSWDAVEGAYGYRLYYRYGAGSWKRMKDVDGLTYTDKGVSLGRTETYTIRALGEDGEPHSGYDAAGWSQMYQHSTPEVTSLQNTNEGIYLRWNSVKGVARYRVYFKGSGGWTALGTTTGTSFLDRKVKS
ncbi:MAG: right-handed parallel beta-helix repeat-containing protein, partial [Ruminococcus sp.]|nr:right-handed parallel beta-helix repeat-containing protein [Ruminococcus sp.]